MLGIGCDLADVERIEKAITRKGFKERVYTKLCSPVRRQRSLPESHRHRTPWQRTTHGNLCSQRRPGQARTESDRLLRIPHRKDGCEKDTPYIKSHHYHCNGSGSA